MLPETVVPVYRDGPRGTLPVTWRVPAPVRWIEGRDGPVEIGHSGTGFAFDCETPRHEVRLHPHALADLLTADPYLLSALTRLGRALEEVGSRHHAFQHAVLIDNGNASDLVLTHEGHGFLDIVVRPSGHDIGRHALLDCHRVGLHIVRDDGEA